MLWQASSEFDLHITSSGERHLKTAPDVSSQVQIRQLIMFILVLSGLYEMHVYHKAVAIAAEIATSRHTQTSGQWISATDRRNERPAASLGPGLDQ